MPIGPKLVKLCWKVEKSCLEKSISLGQNVNLECQKHPFYRDRDKNGWWEKS